jgi:heme o synthase
MSTGTSPSCASPTSAVGEVAVPLRAALRDRLADYLELTRPRIALMALLTVSVGFSLGASQAWNVVPLLHALFGIALVAVSSSVLNQFLERSTDALMPRTADRPLPTERLTAPEAFLFGALSGVGGCVYLLVFVNPLTSLLALSTVLLYVAVYTPLKRRTSLCTVVGAVAGAMPPVLGWTAAGGPLDARALALFSILFLWQFPHFVAIAWLYRDDYARGGLRMLPGSGSQPGVAGLIAVVYALALVPAALLPSELAVADSLAGSRYTAAALLLGLGYFAFAARFARRESVRTARDLLWASLVYLPFLLLALMYDHFRLFS